MLANPSKWRPRRVMFNTRKNIFAGITNVAYGFSSKKWFRPKMSSSNTLRTKWSIIYTATHSLRCLHVALCENRRKPYTVWDYIIFCSSETISNKDYTHTMHIGHLLPQDYNMFVCVWNICNQYGIWTWYCMRFVSVLTWCARACIVFMNSVRSSWEGWTIGRHTPTPSPNCIHINDARSLEKRLFFSD